MLRACPGQDSDVEWHLQQAAQAFQQHRWMLQCRGCSIKHRLRYFETLVLWTNYFFSTASLQTPIFVFTKNICKNLTFNLESFFVALWGLHRARLGQRNGMIFFCTHGICVWIIGPVPWNFFRVKEVHDSIREVCFLHCRFTCRTLSAENTCVESSSNISSPRAPTTNSGHKTENFLQVQSSQQLVNCCEKCGPLGCFASDFPKFLLFHVKVAATLSARRLQVIQSLVCTYNFFSRLRLYIGRAYGRWGWLVKFFWLFDFAPACLSAARLGRRVWNQHYCTII